MRGLLIMGWLAMNWFDAILEFLGRFPLRWRLPILLIMIGFALGLVIAGLTWAWEPLVVCPIFFPIFYMLMGKWGVWGALYRNMN